MSEDSGGKPSKCMSCGFKTTELECYSQNCGEVDGNHWLCRPCIRVRSGNIRTHPRRYPNSCFLQMLCNIGEVIVADIKED